MGEAILLVLWVGSSLFFIIRELKDKDERNSHEWWLSELRECLHSIEFEFQRRCQEITEDAISNYKYSSYEPQLQIYELKKEYLHKVRVEVVKRKGERFLKDFPDYIKKEYERNLSNIVDIYCNLCNILQENLE